MFLMPYANNKGADQSANPRSPISTFVIRCLHGIISLVSISEISSIYLASVAAQSDLCLAWSETPEDRFFSVVSQMIKLVLLTKTGKFAWKRSSWFKGYYHLLGRKITTLMLL